MISCDTLFYSKGVVIDKSTGKPVDSVRISIRNLDTCFTDSLGRYEIRKFIAGGVGDFEILLEKDGFKPKHVNFNADKVNPLDAVIELTQSEGKPKMAINRVWVKRVFRMNNYFFPLLTLFTFLFVALKKKIRRKLLWIAAVLILNLYLQISITDLSIKDIGLHFGLFPFFWHPYSVGLLLPFGTLLFWGFYFFRNNLVVKNV
jgi:hypothetical protein